MSCVAQFRVRGLPIRPIGLVLIISILVLTLPVVGQSNSSPIFPRALLPGDKIAIVAPSGPVNDPEFSLAMKRLREKGFELQIADDIFRRDDYLAGSDARRAEELMDAFRDPTIDAIFAARGGYGASRILDMLDYDVIRANPKILAGFSDITALHLAIFKRSGLVTFHTPVPLWGMGNEEGMKPLTAHWYWRTLMADQYSSGGGPGFLISATWPDTATGEPVPMETFCADCDLPVPSAMVGGVARGRLVGGNLSLIAALAGTPFEMETKDRIVFLEDIGEAPYRVDRMLSTLDLAGRWDDVAGVVLGSFTRRADEDTSDEVRSIDDVLRDYFSRRQVPVMHHFPTGHHVCNITLPIGALAEMDADRGTIRLLEDPVKLK